MKYDYLIVGAGPAGLYATRSILERAGGTAKVALFERSDAPGGRLMSRDLGTGQGIVELGAGRFSASEHHRVARLVSEFGLATKPFEYALSPMQRGLHDQTMAILGQVCAELGEFHKSLGARDRQRLSLQQAALASIGPAKFEYLVDMGGYDTLRNENLSFEDGFELIRHHPETSPLFVGAQREWLAFVGGFSSLASSLHASVAGAVDSAFGHELIEIRRSGPGYELTFETASGRTEVYSDKVVLALPVWATRAVKGLNLSPTIRDRICPVPLLKGYFSYSEPWWSKMEVAGRCFSTSTLFRKIYFPDDGNYLMVYCDGESATKLHEAFVDDRALHENFQQAVRDALPFAMEEDAIPRPKGVGHQYWPHGISFWSSGMNLLPAGFWPIGPNVCICSDLFTPQFGWVEGALASAEAAAVHLCGSQAGQMFAA